MEKGLDFSPGFEVALEEEMLWSFILLQYLEDFEKGGEVRKVSVISGLAWRVDARRDCGAGSVVSDAERCRCSWI